MKPYHAGRGHSRTAHPYAEGGRVASRLDEPGVFQCTILRALELRKEYRDVFLLKEIQGHTLAEIATILEISVDTVLARWRRARRDLGGVPDFDAFEHRL